jgi:serine/threonine-protein kinase
MEATAATGKTPTFRSPWRLAIAWGIAGLMMLIAVFALWNLWRKNTPRSDSVIRFVINYPPRQTPGQVPVFSPDGRYLAFAGYDRLYLQRMDSFEAEPVPGTEGAINWASEAVELPFFSPDSQMIGFIARGALHKVRVTGGAPVSVCGVPPLVAGASWGSDSTLVIGQPAAGLMRVSAEGGTLEKFTDLQAEKGERSHRTPHFLPDGNHVLFTIESDGGPFIAVASLDTGEYRKIIEGSSPHYLPTGHLVYFQLGSLMAVPFDLKTLKLSGTSLPVVDGILSRMWGGVPVPYYTISNTGSLAYVPGGQEPFWWSGRLEWVDRKGLSTPLTKEENAYLYPRISPEGKQLAVSLQTDEGRNIWLYDFEGGRFRRLTFEGTTHFVSTWTPDGQRLTFHSSFTTHGLVWKEVRGNSPIEKLSINEYIPWPGSWSPDGAVLAYTEANPATNGDIWILQRESGEPVPFVHTPYDERHAAFHPDGRLIAYVSDESGQAQVYVQPYPSPTWKKMASKNGGSEPVWSRDGRELFYRLGDKLLVVDVELQPELSLGQPEDLFQVSFSPTPAGPPNYDVSPDGTRFIMIKRTDNPPTHVNVILNWFEELKHKAPSGK